MNKERVINMIKEYKELQVEIDILKHEIESIEVTGISAINYEGEKTGVTYKINKPTEEEAVKLTDKKDRIQNKIFVLEKRVNIIERILGVLNNQERELIYKHIIEGLPYHKFCGFEGLDMSERKAKQIKKDALNKLLKVAENIAM